MKLKIRGLQLLINTESCSQYPLLELATQAILGGIDGIQFRHKGAYDRESHTIALCLVEMCRRFSIPFIINDRFDIAMAVRATGVHLGQTDMPVREARLFLGESAIIGVTSSTIEEAKAAESEGADYVGFGHIFSTATKIKSTPPVGLEALEVICSQLFIPVIAIGGINEGNIEDVCRAGASGIAVISAIASSSNPSAQTNKLKKMMKAYEKCLS
jgi:thiamine-phosphate diphosphorylase